LPLAQAPFIMTPHRRAIGLPRCHGTAFPDPSGAPRGPTAHPPPEPRARWPRTRPRPRPSPGPTRPGTPPESWTLDSVTSKQRQRLIRAHPVPPPALLLRLPQLLERRLRRHNARTNELRSRVSLGRERRRLRRGVHRLDTVRLGRERAVNPQERQSHGLLPRAAEREVTIPHAHHKTRLTRTDRVGTRGVLRRHAEEV